MQQLRRKCPYAFLVFVLGVAGALFAHQTWVWCEFGGSASGVYLAVFGLSFCMLVWSVLASSCTSPGRVPFKWGYYLSDQQVRRRRFCMICQVFKPERSHHCSTCGRCILNMDHHCPWINNCVGFNNRKPFILMLTYALLTLLLAILGLLLNIPNYSRAVEEQSEEKPVALYLVLVCLGLLADLALFVLIFFFYKFHLELMFGNYTTIQILELKRNNLSEDAERSQYDIGCEYNFQQVFGKSKLTWCLPLFCGDQGPAGDGLLWPKLAP